MAESWEEFMAIKQTDNKTGNKKSGRFITPDRYTPDWLDQQTAQPAPLPSGFTVQIEGDYDEPQVLHQASPPPQVVPPSDPTSAEWQIDALSMHGTRVLNVQAYHPGRERTVNFNMEAYYESNTSRTDVANALRSLINLYAEKGVMVTTPRRTPKPDLIEEMYQLLSIVMEDPAFGKYSQQWATVRTQVESQ